MALNPNPAFERDPLVLKRRFKQRCQQTNNVFQNWQIRIHRSLSWSIRAAGFDGEQSEAELLFHWIAFNSLYASWSSEKNAPETDRGPRSAFLSTFASAGTELVSSVLRESKPVLKKLLGSPYLSNVFWRDPDAARATQRATEDLYYLDGMLKRQQYSKVLDLAFERVFVFRGQLVHGASSGGSRLNRGTLEACLKWMRTAVPLVQHLAIEFGAHDSWPDLCYPPIEPA